MKQHTMYQSYVANIFWPRVKSRSSLNFSQMDLNRYLKRDFGQPLDLNYTAREDHFAMVHISIITGGKWKISCRADGQNLGIWTFVLTDYVPENPTLIFYIASCCDY